MEVVRVLLMGNVSAGKSTVLNALLGGDYSQVAMRRTTRGIYSFRISAFKKHVPSLADFVRAQQKNDANCDVEKCFHVVVDHLPCGAPLDATLEIVDTPAMNEADSEPLMKYIDSNWSSFACIIVVMDAKLGVSSEKQLELLKIVKTKQDEIKDVPVIILCNKVDDLHDDEINGLLDEMRSKVEEIFGVSDRNEALREVLDDDRAGAVLAASPAVLPISAKQAYRYLVACKLGVHQIRLDNKVISSIGRDEIGGRSQWSRLSEAEKYDVIYAALREGPERLEASNFDKFQKLLSYFIGQPAVIQHDRGTLEVFARFVLNGQLGAIYEDLKEIGYNKAALKDAFWMIYGDAKRDVFDSLEAASNPEIFRYMMQLLQNYNTFVKDMGWKDQVTLAQQEIDELWALLKRQIECKRPLQNVHIDT